MIDQFSDILPGQYEGEGGAIEVAARLGKAVNSFKVEDLDGRNYRIINQATGEVTHGLTPAEPRKHEAETLEGLLAVLRHHIDGAKRLRDLEPDYRTIRKAQVFIGSECIHATLPSVVVTNTDASNPWPLGFDNSDLRSYVKMDLRYTDEWRVFQDPRGLKDLPHPALIDLLEGDLAHAIDDDELDKFSRFSIRTIQDTVSEASNKADEMGRSARAEANGQDVPDYIYLAFTMLQDVGQEAPTALLPCRVRVNYLNATITIVPPRKTLEQLRQDTLDYLRDEIANWFDADTISVYPGVRFF